MWWPGKSWCQLPERGRKCGMRCKQGHALRVIEHTSPHPVSRRWGGVLAGALGRLTCGPRAERGAGLGFGGRRRRLAPAAGCPVSGLASSDQPAGTRVVAGCARRWRIDPRSGDVPSCAQPRAPIWRWPPARVRVTAEHCLRNPCPAAGRGSSMLGLPGGCCGATAAHAAPWGAFGLWGGFTHQTQRFDAPRRFTGSVEFETYPDSRDPSPCTYDRP